MTCGGGRNLGAFGRLLLRQGMICVPISPCLFETVNCSQTQVWERKTLEKELYPGLRCLTIMRQWFDKIRTGAKTTEYRVASKKMDGICSAPYIKFINGYHSNAPYLIVQSKGWTKATLEEVAAAHPEAVNLFHPDRGIIAIHLGKVLHIYDPKKCPGEP